MAFMIAGHQRWHFRVLEEKYYPLIESNNAILYHTHSSYYLHFVHLSAQNESNDLMKTKIVALLNLKNYKEIYALGDEKFRKDVTENQLLELLKGTAELGKQRKRNY
jgi:hypothetical protein